MAVKGFSRCSKSRWDAIGVAHRCAALAHSVDSVGERIQAGPILLSRNGQTPMGGV